MTDIHLPANQDSDSSTEQPEVRLELTRAGVEQVLSLYSQEQESARNQHGFMLRLEDVDRVLREHRLTLVFGFAIGIALALVVLLASTPLYPVSAQVVLERHDVSSASINAGPGAGGSSFIATQAEVMQSHSVIEAALATIPRAEHLDADANAARDAFESVRASPVSGTQVVALSYLGQDASYGVRLLEAIVDAYRDVLIKTEERNQAQKLYVKNTELAVLDREAAEVEKRVEALRLKHQMFGGAEDAANAQIAIVRDHTENLTEVRNQRIALENRLATGGELLSILDPATRILQEQLWQAEADLARVKLTFRAKHPALEAAQQEVTVLRSQIDASSKATPEALKRDIAAAEGLEAQLQIVVERERQRLAEIESYRREEEILTNELDGVRAMSRSRRSELLDQRLVTRMAESGEVGVTARFIEFPVVPEEAVWPKPGLMLCGGGIVGLFSAFAFALISIRRDTSAWESAPHAHGDGGTIP